MGDDDPIARLRAQMDQSREGTKEFAGLLYVFYAEAVSEGFTADQAFGLTITYLTATLGNALRGGGDE